MILLDALESLCQMWGVGSRELYQMLTMLNNLYIIFVNILCEPKGNLPVWANITEGFENNCHKSSSRQTSWRNLALSWTVYHSALTGWKGLTRSDVGNNHTDVKREICVTLSSDEPTEWELNIIGASAGQMCRASYQAIKTQNPLRVRMQALWRFIFQGERKTMRATCWTKTTGRVCCHGEICFY